MRSKAFYQTLLGLVVVVAVASPGCNCSGDTDNDATGLPGTTSSSSAASGSGGSGEGGAGGSGGSGQGGSTSDLGHHASETVSAGEVSKSPNYTMTFTLGQPTQNQGKSSSPGYQLKGGLIGATGSKP